MVFKQDLSQSNGQSKRGTQTPCVERTHEGKPYMLLPAGGVFDILAVTTQENSVLRDNFEHFCKKILVGFLEGFLDRTCKIYAYV